jgi:hypothetical protein
MAAQKARKLVRYIGVDPSGIKRVYAEHTNPDVAETRCMEEVLKYIKHRPDTGPLVNWKVEKGE